MALETVGAAAWLAAIVGGAAAAGALAAGARGGDRLDRWFTAVFAAVAELLTASVMLACAGLYSRGWLVALQATVGVVSLVARREVVPNGRESLSPRLGMAHAVAGVTAGFVVLAVGVGLFGGRSQHFESLHYHYAGVAHLVTGHSLWGLPFQNPAFFTANHPHNAELLYGVLAHATGADELIYVVSLPVFGVLTVLASAVIARCAGVKPAVGALAALAVLSTPIVFGTQARSIASDLPAAAFVVAALALFMSDRKGWLTTLLAGAALGAAVGTKYTVVVAVGVTTLLALARLGWRRALWLLPGLFVLGAPWYVRNWIETGNPVYPQRVAVGGAVVFEGGETPLDSLSNTIASHALHRRSDAIGTWGDLVVDFYGPTAAIAALGAASGLILRRRGVECQARRTLAGLAVVAGVAYAVTPYTGAGVPPLEFLMGSNLRYALLAITIGTLAAAVTAGRRAGAVVVAVALVWSTWRLLAHPIRGDVDIDASLLAAAALGAVAFPLLALLAPRLPNARLHLSSGIIATFATAAVTFAFAVVALAGPRGAAATAPLEVALDSLLANGRIVTVGVDDLRSVIGSDFRREPVALTPGAAYASAPFASGSALARALDDQPIDVAVIGLEEHPGVPSAFRPSAAWCLVAEVRGVTVYERRPGRCD